MPSEAELYSRMAEVTREYKELTHPTGQKNMIRFEYIGTKPEFGTPEAAGYDLVSSQSITLAFGEIKIVPVDLRTSFPNYKAVLFYEKSGMALKGFDCKGGLIDSDYRKEYGVLLRYLPSFRLRSDGTIELGSVMKPDGTFQRSEETLHLPAGTKLCNMLVFQNDTRFVEWVKVEALQESQRLGGYGSTGNKV